jgi:hypothetical protein
MTELLILGVVAVLAFIFFANRATKPKPAPTPGPDLPKNNPPIACAPLLYGGVTSSTVFIGDPVKLDLRHRVHGCDANGAALDETGAYDPEGDVIEYAVKCTGPSPDGLSQIPYTVFNDQGAQIDSAWIKTGWAGQADRSAGARDVLRWAARDNHALPVHREGVRPRSDPDPDHRRHEAWRVRVLLHGARLEGLHRDERDGVHGLQELQGVTWMSGRQSCATLTSS